MTDAYTTRIDRMVEQIQDFADRVEDAENWTVLIPDDDFDAVEHRLATDDAGLGTRYRGANLCYSREVDEVWVRYIAPLSEHGLTGES